MKNYYTVIEHTADIGVRVKAKSLKKIFKNLARAMFDLIAQKQKTRLTRYKKINIKEKGETREELLVNWLNELLSLSSAKELIFTDFKIKKIDKNSLEAVVSGVKSSQCRIDKEVKAATYHELKIEKIPSGWQAEIIFDV